MTFSTGSHKLVNFITVTSTWTSEEWEGRKEGVEERADQERDLIVQYVGTIYIDYIYMENEPSLYIYAK